MFIKIFEMVVCPRFAYRRYEIKHCWECKHFGGYVSLVGIDCTYEEDDD